MAVFFVSKWPNIILFYSFSGLFQCSLQVFDLGSEVQLLSLICCDALLIQYGLYHDVLNPVPECFHGKSRCGGKFLWIKFLSRLLFIKLCTSKCVTNYIKQLLSP